MRGVFRLRTLVVNREEVNSPPSRLKREKGGAPWSLVMMKKDVDQGADY